ncbi:hypothetical protein [Fusobacterium mortiferum]|uniref:hypothetical protein n=1 Tax=Fusobacterium mortiferum TaxID=850 RepID=UPI00356A46C5
MSINDLQMYITRAKGAYFAKFKVPPKEVNIISENAEEIKIEAKGKDINGKDIKVNILMRKR